MAKIVGNIENEYLEVKKLSLQGISIHDECPRCGKSVSVSLEKTPISFPDLKDTNQIGFECGNCDREWDVNVKLTLSISLVTV